MNSSHDTKGLTFSPTLHRMWLLDHIQINWYHLYTYLFLCFPTCECVSSCLQGRKRSHSHPPTGMNEAPGTRMFGRSRKPQGYVYNPNISDKWLISLLLWVAPKIPAESSFSFSVWQMRTNVPSWCDRILWKSYPETHVVCNSYGEAISWRQFNTLLF